MLGQEGQVSELTIRRVGWTMALLGLVFPAIARFLTSPLDGTTILLAIVAGLALSWPTLLLFLWVATMPLFFRNRSLKRLFPHSQIILAAEAGPHLEPFVAHQEPVNRTRGHFLPLTLVVKPESISFWHGGSDPVLFATIPRSLVEGAELTNAMTGVRRASGIRLILNSSGATVNFVPVERLGNPLGVRKVESLVDGLTDWANRQ